MRDQWRAEDNYRDNSRRRDKGTSDCRHTSPVVPSRQRDSDFGVKIRGRAQVGSATRSPSRSRRSETEYSVRRHTLRGSSRSPQRQRLRDEERLKGLREYSRERGSGRQWPRDTKISTTKRRRTRSRSPSRKAYDSRDERRRPRSPYYSDLADRAIRPRSRRRERDLSPPRPSRSDYHSSVYPENSGLTGRFGDSYVPSIRRSRSGAVTKNTINRRRSRSNPQHYRTREPVLARSKWALSPDRESGEKRVYARAVHRRVPVPRGSPEGRHRGEKPSPHSSRANSRRPARRHWSPVDQEVNQERARKDGKNMQSSTRPIQSILDDGSRPPSPRQRIPSLDSVSNDAPMISETFPLHGMKASNMHSSHRPNRPPHLDTRHSYSASPQWTPTSSHQGSPPSGSPYNQNRVGWGGHQQQFQGQHGWVLSPEMISRG